MITEVLIRELRAEHDSDYALLRRLPNSSLWRTIGYLDTQTSPGREAEFRVFAEAATDRIRTWLGGVVSPLSVPIGAKAAASPVAQLLADINSVPTVYSHFPDRYMTAFATAGASGLAHMVAESRIEAILAAPEPVLATPRQIRFALLEGLAEQYRVESVSGGKEIWHYRSEVTPGKSFVLTVDFGGTVSGFHYTISFGAPGAQSHDFGGLAWESVLGLGPGQWDFVLEDEVPAMLDALNEVIRRSIALHDELLAQV